MKSITFPESAWTSYRLDFSGIKSIECNTPSFFMCYRIFGGNRMLCLIEEIIRSSNNYKADKDL